MYSCKSLPKTKSNHKIDPEYRWDTNKLISSRDNPMWTWSVCLTDWQTPLLFQLPIWRMMATPSFNVPSYKTSHDWLWDLSQPARQSLYFLFNCWLDISLFASLFYNHQTTARVFAGGLFKYYSREQYLILVYIYAARQWRKQCKNKILVTQLNIVTFFAYCRTVGLCWRFSTL